MDKLGKGIAFGIGSLVLITAGALMNGGAGSAAVAPKVTATVTAQPEPAPEVTVTEKAKPAVTKTVEPEAESAFGPGVYLVGEDVEAGSYKTDGPSTSDILDSCYWARNSDDSGEFDSIIANDNITGPSRVTLAKGEVFETSGECEWVKS